MVAHFLIYHSYVLVRDSLTAFLLIMDKFENSFIRIVISFIKKRLYNRGRKSIHLRFGGVFGGGSHFWAVAWMTRFLSCKPRSEIAAYHRRARGGEESGNSPSIPQSGIIGWATGAPMPYFFNFIAAFRYMAIATAEASQNMMT